MSEVWTKHTQQGHNADPPMAKIRLERSPTTARYPNVQPDVSFVTDPSIQPHLRQDLPRNNDSLQALQRKRVQQVPETRFLCVTGVGRQMKDGSKKGHQGD